jgi:predicted GTPase
MLKKKAVESVSLLWSCVDNTTFDAMLKSMEYSQKSYSMHFTRGMKSTIKVSPPIEQFGRGVISDLWKQLLIAIVQ